MLQFGLLLLCTGALAQIPSLGSCPNLKVVEEFDVRKYLGAWYEAERYFAINEMGGKCITAKYSLNEDGSIKVINSLINIVSGTNNSIEGTAKLVGKSGESKLTLSFPSLPVQIESSFWILDTDYSNYSVAWSCQDFGLFNTKIAWIFTRERHPENEVLLKAYEVFNKYDLDKSFLVRTNQKDCN
ncbi:apolipoprotein D-like [Belonocnema kinseyi]|uniref:apolipoprotein D-like n=1 Tax=Belonocnema kinseyi TaxID=2817044 RepID=UPI00143D1452|nr:apolipoprotein D-like [Belonocnema kinseyi]